MTCRASITELARAKGLVEAPAGGYAPCPSCRERQRSGSDRRGPVNLGDEGPSGPWWRCWACHDGGGLDKLRGLLDGDLAQPSPVAPPVGPSARKRKALPLDVATAWEALTAQVEDYEPDLTGYLSGVRRWPLELAEQIVAATRGDLAHAQADGSRLATLADGRPVLTVLRDADGRPRDIDRRVTLPIDGQPKAKRLPKDVTGSWGLDSTRRWCAFGDLRDAIAAARHGAPIWLVEGGPDFWVATWHLRAGRGAVLGAVGADMLPKIADLLATRLGQEAVAAVVITVPHRGDAPTERHPNGAGLDAMAKAEEKLRRVATLVRLAVPVGADGRGDLADLATGALSAAAVAEAIDAHLAQARTLSVAPGAPDFVRGATASFTSAPERLAAAIRQAYADAAPDNLIAVAVSTGGGKSWAAVYEAIQRVAAGGTVACFVRDHAKLNEALAWAEAFRSELGDDVLIGINVVRGALQDCTIFKAAPDPLTRDRIEAAYAALGREMCAGCTYASTCPGAKAPRVVPGGLTLACHAALPTLEMPEGAAVVIDELPELVAVEALPFDQFCEPLTLHACHRWRCFHPDAAESHSVVRDVLRGVAEKRCAAEPDRRYALVVDPGELRDALIACPGVEALRGAWESPQVDMLDPNARPFKAPKGPPLPKPAEAREGHMRFAHPRAWPMTEACFKAALAGRRPPIWLRINPKGAIEILSTELLTLPPEVPVVLLDATAHVVTDQLTGIAAVNKRCADIRRLGLHGIAPFAAIWIDGSAFKRSALFLRDSSRLDPALAARLQGLLETVCGSAAKRGDGRARVGLLTWKALAGLLRAEIEPDPADSDVVAAIREVIAAYAARGIVLAYVGHHGRDGVGTNAFTAAKCDALVIWGDARPDMGTVVDVEVGALNRCIVSRGLEPLDGHATFEARVAANNVQAVGRARHSRPEAALRPWILVFAGKSPPPLLERPWTKQSLPRTHRRADAYLDAQRHLEAALRTEGAGSVQWAQRQLDAAGLAVPARCTLQKWLKDAAAQARWKAYRVGFMDVYAADAEQAGRHGAAERASTKTQ
ncbi:MAG: hypothetical protein KC620_15715 [Myxococcales bacterium]|nr:hypothetical protein [Myxococcales bacterium]